MATIKVTNKDFYNAFIALANGEEIAFSPEQVAEWCEKKIAQLEKKSATGSSKPTKTQVENETFKAEILRVLIANGDYMTISEIQADSEMLKDLKNQKMSALLRQLGADGTKQVEKVIDKRVTRFKAVEVEDTAE